MKSDILERGCQLLNLSITEKQEEQFMQYYELLV